MGVVRGERQGLHLGRSTLRNPGCALAEGSAEGRGHSAGPLGTWARFLPVGCTEQHTDHDVDVCATPVCTWACLTPHLTSGENIAADGHMDLSKLEVSLTLTNKFEGLEADADDTSARSLLLRWVRPASESPNQVALLSGHSFLGSLALPEVPLGPNLAPSFRRHLGSSLLTTSAVCVVSWLTSPETVLAAAGPLEVALRVSPRQEPARRWVAFLPSL